MTENELVQQAGDELRRRRIAVTPQKVEHFVREHTPPSAEEIEAALPRDCVAIQNVATGAVAVFAMPMSYNDELSDLKAEAKQLKAVLDDHAISVIERMRATQRLADVTRRIETIEVVRAGDRLRHLMGR